MLWLPTCATEACLESLGQVVLITISFQVSDLLGRHAGLGIASLSRGLAFSR